MYLYHYLFIYSEFSVRKIIYAPKYVLGAMSHLHTVRYNLISVGSNRINFGQLTLALFVVAFNPMPILIYSQCTNAVSRLGSRLSNQLQKQPNTLDSSHAPLNNRLKLRLVTLKNVGRGEVQKNMEPVEQELMRRMSFLDCISAWDFSALKSLVFVSA